MNSYFGYDEWGIFDPHLAASAWGRSARFGGGGGGGNPPKSGIGDTPVAKWARKEMYPLYQQGMAGGTLMPSTLRTQRQQSAFTGLQSSQNLAAQEYASDLSRMLDPRDSRLRGHLMEQFNRQGIRAKDDLTRQFRMEGLQDQDIARGMAFGAVGNEMRMGIDSMQQYNQAAQQQAGYNAQYGTMGTNIAGGFGSGLTNMYYAQKMAGQG